jgi:hypothetical protein
MSPFTEEHRAKLRAAKLGKPKPPEHRAAISEAIRKAYADGARMGLAAALDKLTPKERDEYAVYIRSRYSRAEALIAVNREDLI